MKIIVRTFVLCFTLFLISNVANAQSIKGKVTSDDGETLPGVSILLNETQQGTITDIDGNFKFEKIKAGSYSLQISCMGFDKITQNIEVGNNGVSGLNIKLTPSNVELGSIQVVGKSATRLVREQAYQVESISALELFNTTADAKDVMSRIAGVNIQEDGGMGSDFDFSLNGFSGDQVKFFMDGIPMDNFGSSMNLGDLPVNMIERIDVYKGVVPVWLGTDALGGAINIITNSKQKYFDASYSYGSFNTHRASLNGAKTWDNGFTVRGNIFYNYSDNDYDVYVAKGNGDTHEDWYSRFHDAYESATVKVEAGVVDKPYADQLLLGIIGSANDKEEQTGATMATVYGGVLSKSQSVIPSLKYSKANLFTEGLGVSLYSALSLNEAQSIDTLRGYTYDWSGEATVIPNSNNGEIGTRNHTVLDNSEFSLQFNANYILSSQSSLALNYSLTDFHRSVSDTINPEEEANQFPKDMVKHVLGAAFKYDVGTRWSTTFFGKYYYLSAKTSKLYDRYLPTERVDELVNQQGDFGYGLASSYFVLPSLQLKLSYEYAVRMPTPEEMFGDGLFIDPNPDLVSETSQNLNFGAEFNQHFASYHNISAGASFVYRNASDLIYTIVSPGSPITTYGNSQKIRVLGVEGNFKYDYKNIFHVGGSVTYQNITDRAKEILTESASGDYWTTNYNYGYRLPNQPYFFANLNAGLGFDDVMFKNSHLAFDYYFNYTQKYFLTWAELGTNNDEYIIPQQVSHDIQLSYSFKNGRYNISAMCTNLFDAMLYDKYYLQKPGRAFSIKLRYSL